MPDLKATLKRKVGPLPVWAWGAVAATGVGLGLYLRSRRGPATSFDEPVDELGTGVIPVDVTGRGPGAGTFDPFLPFDPVLPDDPLLPDDPSFLIPEVFDCPDGYLYNPLINMCVPDPGIATPGGTDEPNEIGRGDRAEQRQRLRRRRSTVRDRISDVRSGGVTSRERPVLRKLKQRLKRIGKRLAA